MNAFSAVDLIYSVAVEVSTTVAQQESLFMLQGKFILLLHRESPLLFDESLSFVVRHPFSVTMRVLLYIARRLIFSFDKSLIPN